uniref:Uncharacterized protein n=1 Tax=Desulfatirhabdium butyrativorans TaxID=340467 RepID=A0A7C4W6F8_9BACT
MNCWNRKAPIRSTMMMAILLMLITALSCATNRLSPPASKVRLLATEEMEDCKAKCEFIAHVTGQSSSLSSSSAYHNSLTDLMENAARVGATHLFVNLGENAILRGEAYRCAYCVRPDGRADVSLCEGANAVDPAACQVQGGIWMPIARDRATCEAKGGVWVLSDDVSRLPDELAPAKKKTGK